MQKYREGTEYTQQMLMWECRGGSYYAGQVGTISRFPTRQTSSVRKRTRVIGVPDWRA